MKKVKAHEVTSEMPDDFDYSKQELHISIKARPVGPEEDDSIETEITCKMHGTNNFAKGAIHTFLKDDEVMFELFKEVITDMLLDQMMRGSRPMMMGQGGQA